jgi:cytochrome c-type biogenesis protein CcmH/NrfG
MITPLETWSIAQLGYLYFTRDRFDEAEKIFTGLVTLDPKHTYSWYILGLIALHKQDLKQAYSYLQHVLTLDPNHHDARLRLAEQLLRAGHRQDARDLLASLLDLPDLPGRRARLLLSRHL